uniref:CCHC-type domain-containing protein n=1 Tax=Amphimedon queenslandica TaxID=400682 RepID=A0A1X7VSI5_AMPQE
MPTGGSTCSSHSDCYCCGGKHSAAQCRFKDFECHFCKKRGHLASVCPEKGVSRPSEQEDTTDKGKAIAVEGDEESSDYPLCSIFNCTPSKPLLVKVFISGVSIKMELDTGVSVSLMGEDTYCLIKDSASLLQQSSVRLHTYTGEGIKVIGAIDVTVVHNGQQMTLPLIVMKGKGPPRLGRNWLSVLKLDWQHIFKVESNRSLHDALSRFNEEFNETWHCTRGES